MVANSDTQIWRNTLIPLGSNIQDAINCLEKSSMQIVMVVTDGDRLVGSLTDGDIRRAFYMGLRSIVISIMRSIQTHWW